MTTTIDSENKSTFEYDTGFLCTYHLMNDNVANDSDSDREVDNTMSENLYRIQLSQALRMNIDFAKVIAGYESAYDVQTMNQFTDFILDKTKPYYDDRYKAVLRKHPCLTFKCENRVYDDSFYSNGDHTKDANDVEEPAETHTEPGANEKRDHDGDGDGDGDDDIETLINDVVPMLMSYDSFHAFHRCMIDVFSVPNAMGLISDESLRLLEGTYDKISESMQSMHAMNTNNMNDSFSR